MVKEDRETILDLLEQHVSDTASNEDDPLHVLKRYLHNMENVYVKDVVEEVSFSNQGSLVEISVTFSGYARRQ